MKTLRGIRAPKSYVLSGVRSSDGKRLDQSLNRNLGAELAKLSREKSELQQGLGGGNKMSTYTLKRFTAITLHKQKTYKLKRKTFGLGDGIGEVGSTAIKTVGNTANKAVGTVENVAGGAMTGVGKGMDSFVGRNIVGAVGGGLLGTAAGLALGPLGLIAAPILGAAGGLAGRGIMSGGGKLLKGVGEGLKDDAATRTA